MEYSNQLPEWKNTGTEPSTSLKNNGFQGGYKPPAGVFNWFWSTVSKAITELQTKLSAVKDEAVGEKQKDSMGGAVSGEAFNDTANNEASGIYSHAEGEKTTASGNAAHAEGKETTASGDYSHAEGLNTVANGTAGYAGGAYTFASGNWAFAHGFGTKSNANQAAFGKYNTEVRGCTTLESVSASEAVFVVGTGTSETSRSNALRIRADSRCCGSQAFAASGADYAEYFEWSDGNKNSEDRRGRLVTLDGEKIRIANDGDFVIGVISAAPCFVGNTQSEEWQGRYETDVFGERVKVSVDVPEKVDVTGKTIPAHKEERFVVNPDYDTTLEYIPREFRKEWSPVGLIGKLVAIDDGSCQVNGYCKVANGGVVTSSEAGWRVLKRLDETHILILYR